MNFLKGLFAGGKGDANAEQGSASQSPPANDGELFVRYLSSHLNRIDAQGGAYSSFIRQYFPSETITILAAAANDKMTLTQADLKEHSFCVSQAPVSYWICTLALSIKDARGWFVRAYGGYSKLLERVWNSDYYRGSGCEVLVHIVYGRTGAAGWVNMAVFPIGPQEFVSRFGIKPILPSDLLTEAEMRA